MKKLPQDKKLNSFAFKFTMLMLEKDQDPKEMESLKSEYLKLDGELSLLKQWVKDILGYDPSKYFFRTIYRIVSC